MSAQEEHNKEMKQIVLSIEAEIGQKLSENITPELLITTSRILDRILDYMMNPEDIAKLNWKEPIALEFADGEIILRVIRTQDLKYGQVIIK